MEFITTMGDHVITVVTNGVDREVERLVPLRFNAFLRPDFSHISAGIEKTLDITLPSNLNVQFNGSHELVRSPATWHRYLPDGDLWGLETIERALVQIVAGADAGADDVTQLHAVACRLIERWVDTTFVCALELL